jgi:hypothetical protein
MMVLNNPFDINKQTADYEIFERFFSHIDVVKSRKEWVKKIAEEIKIDIDKHIEDKNPELLTNFHMIYGECENLLKQSTKIINSVEKKVSKLFDSSNLAEDVFKMRDEMKKLRQKLDKFNKALKSFSTLSLCLDDDNQECNEEK